MFFVTAFAGALDLRSGELDYCNAGHDNPYLLTPGRPGLER
jgi:serine phosphatase RsbU (regulator of sigma subunit)